MWLYIIRYSLASIIGTLTVLVHLVIFFQAALRNEYMYSVLQQKKYFNFAIPREQHFIVALKKALVRFGHGATCPEKHLCTENLPAASQMRNLYLISVMVDIIDAEIAERITWLTIACSSDGQRIFLTSFILDIDKFAIRHLLSESEAWWVFCRRHWIDWPWPLLYN